MISFGHQYSALINFLSLIINQMMYYGKRIGELNHYAHGVYGEVYAIDTRRIWLRGFSYDGEGPGNINTSLL